jgi:peptide/nickel transport system permease protein
MPVFARVARGATLQVMSRDFIRAAQLARVPKLAILRRHVLPNIAGLMIVQASTQFALAILAEAGLSYLGIGTQPPNPSWGRMLNDAQTFLAISPRLALLPGMAIALSVLAFNLLGDGLRDILDPRLEER